MFNIFKNQKFFINAVCDGKVMPITTVNDEVFSKKLLGDGYAIKPINGKIYSPVNGTVTTIFPTKHAIGITTENGLEILIHLGIDTVDLKVKQGDKVKQDDYLASMDIETIIQKKYNDTVIVVYTNMDTIKSISNVSVKDITHGQVVQTVELK